MLDREPIKVNVCIVEHPRLGQGICFHVEEQSLVTPIAYSFLGARILLLDLTVRSIISCEDSDEIHITIRDQLNLPESGGETESFTHPEGVSPISNLYRVDGDLKTGTYLPAEFGN